jgi:hypothetical protein
LIPEIEFKVASQGNNPEAYKACEEFIKKWQKILRIQEWEIGLEFLSGLEMQKLMGSDDYNASCGRTTENKTAMISINCESPQMNDELENSIIHELLHIVFDEYQTFTENAIKDNDYALNAVKLKMEQTIENLARSFTSLTKEDGKGAETTDS